MVCLTPATLISDVLLGPSCGSPQQGWEETEGFKSFQNPSCVYFCWGVQRPPRLPPPQSPLFLRLVDGVAGAALLS